MLAKAIKCIWMEAEVVEYKLCQLNYDCDSCTFHHKMTGRLATEEQPPEDSSITIPLRLKEPSFNTFKPGYQYYDNYIWIKHVGKAVLLIGLEDFFLDLWDNVSTIILANIDTTLTENSCFAWFVLPQGIVYLRIPLTGRVIDQNPHLASKDYDFSEFRSLPLSEKWILKLALLNEPLDRGNWMTKSQYLKNLTTGWQLVQSNLREHISPGSEKAGLPILSSDRKIQTPIDTLKQLLNNLSHDTHFFC